MVRAGRGYCHVVVHSTSLDFFGLREQVFIEYTATDACTCSSTLTPQGVEEVCPTWLQGADGWVCSLLYAVHQMLSLVPCTVTVSGAAGHDRG